MIAITSMIIFTMMSGTKNGELFYLFGILSVIYWKMTGDLRLYLVILIGMPLYIALKYYENKKVKNDVILLLFFYLLCRIVEHNDHFIYKITNNTISGHTLKHIFAGLSIYYTIKLLEKIKAAKTHGTKAGQWSARKAQLLAKKYKALGGGDY